jgi:hypothetical protein
MTDEPPHIPDALLLIAPDCTRCPTVLEALSRLIKEGAIGRLEVVSLAIHPEVAQRLEVRSVPWTRLGPFLLEGLHSYAELKDWARAASGQPDFGRYLAYLIENRRLEQALELVRTEAQRLDDLLDLVGASETPIGVRIGAGALLEELEGSSLLERALPRLLALCEDADPGTRADACHYLSLVGDRAVIPHIKSLLGDPDPHVREIAKETLESLESSPGSGTAPSGEEATETSPPR